MIIPYHYYQDGKKAILSKSTANEQEDHTAIIVVDYQGWFFLDFEKIIIFFEVV